MLIPLIKPYLLECYDKKGSDVPGFLPNVDAKPYKFTFISLPKMNTQNMAEVMRKIVSEVSSCLGLVRCHLCCGVSTVEADLFAVFCVLAGQAIDHDLK